MTTPFMQRLEALVQPHIVADLKQRLGETGIYHKLLSTLLLSTSSKTTHDSTTHNAVLFLAPAQEVSIHTLCPWSTKACRESCLIYTGRLRMTPSHRARMFRTILFLVEPDLFRTRLVLDIQRHEAQARVLGIDPVVRLNGTSDLQDSTAFRSLPAATIFTEMPTLFPDVHFVEYTKNPKMNAAAPNQHMTFSYAGSNHKQAIRLLSQGQNVSVIFDGPMPKEWNGFSVIDGETHDNRYKDPSGVVVGLKLKGPHKMKRLARDNKLVITTEV